MKRFLELHFGNFKLVRRFIGGIWIRRKNYSEWVRFTVEELNYIDKSDSDWIVEVYKLTRRDF